jgi:Nucleotidyl transferase AbiEii toxin, Type IV TA system
MDRLRDSPDDLIALCGAAATSLGIPDPAFVEKDFWVVELLRSVVQPLTLEPTTSDTPSAQIIFKGGTSLSKAYDLIKRFSEDVDILALIQGYGASARDRRVLRPICERARTDLGLTTEQMTMLDYKEGTTRPAEYHYPRHLDASVISDAVKLEMGIRGGTLPGTHRRTVVSYIAQHIAAQSIKADYMELVPVEVDVIAPVRTLAEKLALLHHAGHMAMIGDKALLTKVGRHIYDVHQLLDSQDVRAALSIAGQTMPELAADVDAKSNEFRFPHTPRPTDGYAVSPIFDLSSPLRPAVEASYHEVMDLVWGARPTFDECLATIHRARPLL